MEYLIIIALVLIIGVVSFLKASAPRSDQSKPTSDEDKFTATPLFNKSEASLLRVLDRVCQGTLGQDIRIFSQVSYGEFLKGSTRAAYAKISQKRADFVGADPQGRVVCVIEYQGSGHFGKSDASRARAEKSDAMKRRALSSAGIPMVEIPAEFTVESVRDALSTVG